MVTTASNTKVQQLLQDQQEEAYRRLGWQPRTYRQADLYAWVKEYETQQLNTFAGRAHSTSEYDAAVNVEISRRIERLGEKELLKLPTKYEDPKAYLEVAILIDQLEEGMTRSFGHTLVPRPVFGTLPTGQVEATASRKGWGDEYFVTFNSGLSCSPTHSVQPWRKRFPSVMNRPAGP
jgi:hypothetical protein